MCLYVCSQGCGCICRLARICGRQEVNLRCHSSGTTHIAYRDKVSFWSEAHKWSRLAGHCAQEIFLSPQELGLQASVTTVI